MSTSKRKISNANEILELLNKQWLCREDIEQLASCKRAKATKIMHEINEKAKYKPVNGLVPTDLAVEHLGININYLKKIREIV